MPKIYIDTNITVTSELVMGYFYFPLSLEKLFPVMPG